MLLRGSLLLTVLLTLAFPQSAPAAEDELDLSRWRCRFCPYETGLDGNLALGFGLAFDDAYRFGNGTGLEDDGVYLLGDMSLTWWGEDARFYELDANKLGTRARALTLTGGIQGRYTMKFSYDELPYRNNNTGATPFLGVGGSNLTLPTGWQTAGNTRLMPDLAGALTPLALSQDRKNIGLDLRFLRGSRWTHELSYSRTTRNGIGPHSGNFLTLSSILPAAIDYETDILQASVAYLATNWQARLAYENSYFSNGDALINWQNPFNPLAPGAVSGLAARPPDNNFQQLSLTGNYRTASNMTLVGNVALGKASQDELLPAYTSNTLLPTVALPAATADGRIDSSHINAGVQLSGRFGRSLRYRAFYRRHERDNETPARDWQPVVTDVFQDSVRTNTPFSFAKADYGVNLRLRIQNNLRAAIGVAREDYKRDLQEVRETNENSYWLKLSAHSGDHASLSFNARRENRDGSGYRPVSSLSPPENPLLRKYNMADRDRTLLSAELSVNPRDNIGLSLLGEYANDDYPDSVVGLKESEDRSLTLDATYQPMPRLSLHGFLTRQSLEYSQAGAGNVLWAATGEDRFITGGLNLDLRSEDSRQHLRINYTRSDSRGTSNISAGSGLLAFPDLSADLEIFSAAFTGSIRDNLRARLSYQYERYHSRDWQIEGVTSSTIGNVLTFGEALPNYTQQIIWLGLVKNF